MDDISDEFETGIATEPPVVPPGGSPRFLTATEAAELADNPEFTTSRERLLSIVKTRIMVAARKRKTSLERPFSANKELGFHELLHPATDGAKRGVLEDIQAESHGSYGVEVGEDIDAAVIKWDAPAALPS